jgi:hypothetical protein
MVSQRHDVIGVLGRGLRMDLRCRERAEAGQDLAERDVAKDAAEVAKEIRAIHGRKLLARHGARRQD